MPNCQETFSTQATKVKKLLFLFHLQYPNFENRVTNFDKDRFRKESFCGTNSYSQMNTIFKTVVICFNYKTTFYLPVVLIQENVKKLLRSFEYSKSPKLRNFQYWDPT